MRAASSFNRFSFSASRSFCRRPFRSAVNISMSSWVESLIFFLPPVVSTVSPVAPAASISPFPGFTASSKSLS